MKYKICQIVFSTNRLEYLLPSLQSHKFLNYYNCDVHKILIDDYPKNRNNLLVRELARFHGINEIILNEENKGLSLSWTDTWNLIKDRNYDYVFHMEDDVEILEPVLITDLIEILEQNPDISQTILSRQAWYHHEKDPELETDDLIYKNFRYKKGGQIFSPMASLYSHGVTKINFREFYNFNLNEGLIGQVLRHFGKTSANIKNFHGKNIINHIGEYSVGKRVLEGEPGYEQFGHFNPNLKYSSRDGSLLE